jgi:hypothetical protein
MIYLSINRSSFGTICTDEGKTGKAHSECVSLKSAGKPPAGFHLTRIEDGLIHVSGRMPSHIQEINLSDGTRCAVYAYRKQGGISCDWSKTEAEASHE